MDDATWSGRGAAQGKGKGPICGAFGSGETRTRTGDTTIFSRVLYQLSYLAVAPQTSVLRGRPGAAQAAVDRGDDAPEGDA